MEIAAARDTFIRIGNYETDRTVLRDLICLAVVDAKRFILDVEVEVKVDAILFSAQIGEASLDLSDNFVILSKRLRERAFSRAVHVDLQVFETCDRVGVADERNRIAVSKSSRARLVDNSFKVAVETNRRGFGRAADSKSIAMQINRAAARPNRSKIDKSIFERQAADIAVDHILCAVNRQIAAGNSKRNVVKLVVTRCSEVIANVRQPQASGEISRLPRSKSKRVVNAVTGYRHDARTVQFVRQNLRTVNVNIKFRACVLERNGPHAE